MSPADGCGRVRIIFLRGKGYMGNSLRKAFILAVSVCLCGVFAGQSQGQTMHYVALGGSNIFPYSTWSDAATTITGAVSASSNGDTIWVADGHYDLTAPVVVTNGITLSGTNEACGAIVDGQNSVRCFELNHAQAVVANLTVQKGYVTDPEWYSGGLDIITGTVINCTIVSNRVETYGAQGGGICIGPGGVLTNSRVLFNTVTGSLDELGGGVFVWGDGNNYGRVYATEIRGNQAYSSSTSSTNSGGGGIFFYQGGYGESLQIKGNISQGTQGAGGGAMLYKGGLLKGSQVVSNEAVARGGGIALNEGGQIVDCDVISNKAGNVGGGLDFFLGGNASGVYCVSNNALQGGGANFSYGGAATNCTFVYNSAQTGGGIYITNTPTTDQGRLSASIVSFNQPDNYFFSSTFSQYLEYCLTTPSNAFFNGAGNVIGEPTLLADGSGRLQAGSLGIDQGGSSGAPRREDLLQNYPADGNFDGTALFDIGAFEFSDIRDSDSDGIPDGWVYRYFGQITGIAPNDDADGDSRNNLWEYQNNTSPVNDLDDGWTWVDGLPLGWRYKYFPGNPLGVGPDEHADEDGMSNLDEAIAGTNPTNSASCFQLLVVKEASSGGLRLHWMGAPDRTYHIYSADSLIPTNSFLEIHSVTQGPRYGEMEYVPETGNYFRLSVKYK